MTIEALLKDATETLLLHKVFGKLHKHHGCLVTMISTICGQLLDSNVVFGRRAIFPLWCIIPFLTS